MGFLFDSLVHLLSSDPSEKRAAAARMFGRVLKADPISLAGPPADADYGIWHFKKASPRPVAVTVTVGWASEEQARELLALSLADAQDPANAAMGRLLGAVASAAPRLGEVVELPEGTLGRSAHTHAVTVAFTASSAASLTSEPHAWGQVLGARLDLVVPVTAREAEWIAQHGLDAYVAAMSEQGIEPWADRAPGETRLIS